MFSRRELANAVRALSMDAVEKAKSGHPGAPLGMADMAEALWRGVLKHNPADPAWPDRDRFVLSNGHASMLLYSLLHLTGYELSLDELRNFRQWGSKTPGHPEFGHTPGVETTTGPLGQGLASAVGMAIAETALAAEFNRPGLEIVNHYTYVFTGDGCLMEGISHEACSLAGTLKLGKLIVLYDSNGISIDGKVEAWFAEDVAARFKAYGWQVVEGVDGHDGAAVEAAILEAKADTERPSLIICHTHIGFGSPNKVDSAASHGSPLGAEEVAAARAALGWTHEPFVIPDEYYRAWDCREKGSLAQAAWEELFARYEQAFPELAREFRRRVRGALPENLEARVKELAAGFAAAGGSLATRQAGLKALNGLSPLLPELFGGSADLTGSVGTRFDGVVSFGPANRCGRYLHYGVREFGMGAIMNGLALHGGFIPYGGTFLIFSDYAVNAIRLAALMRLRTIWVLTHDSIGVGEDGPTHQPVEQIPALRLIPGLKVWRPCDTVETAFAWENALQNNGPSVLALSRQNLPCLPRSPESMNDISRGAYIIRQSSAPTPQAIIIATGSEVEPAIQAAVELAAPSASEGSAGDTVPTPVDVRVVSMPCAEVFEAQSKEYRDFVLPPNLRARVAVEAAQADWWSKYVGLDGQVVGMRSFGASAPAGALFAHFGIGVEAIKAAVRKVVKK